VTPNRTGADPPPASRRAWPLGARGVAEQMTNAERILKALEKVGGGCCDTCLSRRSRVAARQQVNQICRRLEDAGTITRGETTCGVCGAAKTVSVLANTSHQRRKPRPSAADVSHSPSPEEMRNQLDRFCTGLWEKRGSGQKPDGLAALIAELSDRGAIPMHQANMMHTVRALRNAYVHDHIRIGPREAAVLDGAWGIIHDWAEGCERGLWRRTSR